MRWLDLLHEAACKKWRLGPGSPLHCALALDSQHGCLPQFIWLCNKLLFQPMPHAGLDECPSCCHVVRTQCAFSNHVQALSKTAVTSSQCSLDLSTSQAVSV